MANDNLMSPNSPRPLKSQMILLTFHTFFQ